MPTLVYNGSISNNVFNNATVGDDGSTLSLNFLDTPIVWSEIVPNPLVGQTLGQLLKNSFYLISYSLTITVTGSQIYNDSSYPTATFSISDSNGTYTLSYQPPSAGSSGTSNYNVNQTISQACYVVVGSFNCITKNISYPTSIYTNVWNVCYSGLPGCIQYSASGFNVNLILGIHLTADCTDNNLDNLFCTEYCLTNANACLNDMLTYCTPNTTNPLITTDVNCQQFFKNYIVNVNPIAQLDTSLETYCQAKYTGFGDLFGSGNQTDIDLCACHMPQAQYDAFEAQLTQLYPGFGNLGVNERCLLPQCASSNYKTTGTTKVCNLPNCINIVSFNNSGTFNGSPVIINQSGQCANLTGGNQPNPPIPPSPIDSMKIILIVIGVIVGIILMIILISIIIGIARRRKSSYEHNSSIISSTKI